MDQGNDMLVRRFSFDKEASGLKRYPFKEMGIGDTFVTKSSESNRVKAAACSYGKRHGQKFRTRVVDNEVECTRVS